MLDNPIFIVGTERSGSNLLRLLLSELAGVCVPHPPHLMRDLSPLLMRYGDLNVDKNYARLIHHAVRLVALHFAPWPVQIDAAELLANSSTRSLYAVYAGIYDQYRRSCNKARWACKSTFMIHHIDEILAHTKAPQFIHLVRDARDVAASARHSVFSHYHPFLVAELWRGEQRLGLEAAAKLGPERWLTLRYEDLTAQPELSLQRVCAFLHEPYCEDLMRFFTRPGALELSTLSRSWRNVARPVIKDNSQKFRTELSVEEIQWIESVAHLELLAFGYPLIGHSPFSKPGRLQQAGFRLTEEWRMLKGESKALVTDRNSRLRLKKKAYLWSLRFR